MSHTRSNIWATLALLAFLQVDCVVPGGDQAALEPPPEGTYTVRAGQASRQDWAAEVQFAEITSEFFEIYKAAVLLGRTMVIQDFETTASPVAIVSQQLWEEVLGGTPEIIGQTIRLDGRDRTVIGVMPSGSEWPKGVQIWIPRGNP